MSFTKHIIVRAVACLCFASALSGCDTSDREAQAALTDYQAAAAANDIPAARKALLKLVTAKDDVSDYWAELGKLEASTGRFGEASYAFNRAYELDRRNVDLVRTVTQLALRTGDIESAKRHAAELEVLAPNDPWIKLTKGWAAITQSDFDQAIAQSDAILAETPFDSSATVMKGRALIGADRLNDAKELLEKQVSAQPNDAGSLRLLERIYEVNNDWVAVARVAQMLRTAAPGDTDNTALLIQAAFRSDNVALGRQASASLLKPDANPSLVASVLDLWTQYWSSPQRSQDAAALAANSPGNEQKMVYARYLSSWGSPQDAIRIASPVAGLPVTAANAEANAVLADAWSRGGNLNAAKGRFDAVLAYDAGNATALKGRSELLLRTGNSKGAAIDAQKLVTVAPTSADARLLLAKSFAAAGNQPWANRTLWSAFQDIPGNDKIYRALLATRTGDSDATLELQEEFARQRQAEFKQVFG